MTGRHGLVGAGAGLLAFALAVAVGLVPVDTAAATRATAAPLPITAASVTQVGRLLSWEVEASQPFSPGTLQRERKALCLLISASRRRAITGKVCVAGPARGSRQARLVYMKVAGDSTSAAVPVPATITRTSSSELAASFLPSSVGLTYRSFYWQVLSSRQAAACAASARSGRCFALYPSQPALLRLHTPILVGCQARGPSVVYHGPLHPREIALTFDDGPWNNPPTLDFLRLLEREQVPATFFVIGRQIASYDPRGAIEKRMLADGDMIGDHTWSHPDVAALKPAHQRAQLLDTVDAIRQATDGFTPCLWRPPYGDITHSLVKLARSLGLLTIMWNVDPRDWSLPGVNAIYSNVVAHATPGAIVIQHFGGGPRFQTLDALSREIATLRGRGYQFVTVAQLLGLELVYR